MDEAPTLTSVMLKSIRITSYCEYHLVVLNPIKPGITVTRGRLGLCKSGCDRPRHPGEPWRWS